MKSDSYDEKGVRKNKRNRYWSVMLVGDHGRIIPFRWFKGMAISVLCLLIVCILAVITMGYLFGRQKLTIAQLHTELDARKKENAQLRDEKDLYLTKLVVLEKQNPEAAPKAPEAKKTEITPRAGNAPAAAKVAVPKPAPAVAKPAPKPVAVKWAADVQGFEASYSPEHQILKAAFKIYNKSSPKEPLEGRIVVVFKNPDKAPLLWFAVPQVQLTRGEPSGSRGKAFKINNYRTMEFRAYGQTAPVKFNMATVFVYTDGGELIFSKDFRFHIDYQPPPQPAAPPAVPEPEPSKEKESTTPSGGPGQTSPAAPSQPAVNPAEPPGSPQNSSPPTAAPAADPAAGPAPAGRAAPDAGEPVSGGEKATPGTQPDSPPAASSPPAAPPDAESKPNSQGEQQ